MLGVECWLVEECFDKGIDYIGREFCILHYHLKQSLVVLPRSLNMMASAP